MIEIILASCALALALSAYAWSVIQSDRTFKQLLLSSRATEDMLWKKIDDLNTQLNYFHQVGQQMAGFELEKARINAQKYQAIAETALAQGKEIPKDTGEAGSKFGQGVGHRKTDLNPVKHDVGI